MKSKTTLSTKAILYIVLLSLTIYAWAVDLFDPRYQPISSIAAYVLSDEGLAAGDSKIYRPYYDAKNWWGDLESYE